MLTWTGEWYLGKALGRYQGWQIEWTGWKPSQSSDRLAGQFLAHKDGRYLHASVPGASGPYSPGWELDISPRPEQVPITAMTDPGVRFREQVRALAKLYDLIDELETNPALAGCQNDWVVE